MAEATGSSGLVDIKIEIKEEPVFVEASAAESEDLDHTDDPLKEEIKDEEEVDVDLLKDEIIVGEPSCSSEEASRLHTGELSGHDASTSSCLISAAAENDEKNTNPTKEAERIHKCQICNKNFTSSSSLKIHTLIHAGVKRYQCETCGKCFTTKPLLRQHVFIHKDLKPYNCETCGKSFNHISNYRTHCLIHEGVRNHMCDICGKGFTQAHSLRRHVTIHKNVIFVKCDVCGKNMRESKLENHILMHTEVKPYKHERRRKRVPNLQTHLAPHEEPKSNKCHICGKDFVTSQTLRRHMTTHQEVAFTICDICGKTMKESTLKTHYIFHMDSKYKCEICGQLFDDEPARNSHVLNYECRTKIVCNM